MIYAQFYNTKMDGTLGEACGDRSVLRLDGRMSKHVWHDVAADWGRKHKYLAYSIHKGNLLEHKPSGDIRLIYS